jgi:hypothetical protein
MIFINQHTFFADICPCSLNKREFMFVDERLDEVMDEEESRKVSLRESSK